MSKLLPILNIINSISVYCRRKLNRTAFSGWCLTGVLFLFFANNIPAFAEGSKELIANGGNRAYLYSSNIATPSFPFPTVGTTKVYVKVGETINVGSSAQGMGAGTINLRAPDGSTYTSGNSTTVGLITNLAQELAGPQPNAGGYTPFTKTVLAGQAGVWEIDFVAPNNGANSGASPAVLPALANWTQPFAEYIAAFDISVRDASNTSFLTGRVYTNIFSGLLGAYDIGFNAIVQILTKDGYQYTLNNNGQAGDGFAFFVNNKGFRNASGAASYQSVDNVTSPNVQDPRVADTQTDITHKIFFNAPAADLPTTANTPGGGTTWLLNPPFVPTISNVGFTGIEGTASFAGTSPMGGSIGFTAGANGTYIITIDVNKNGVFTDAIDRKITGIVNTGTNSIYWDGLDGLGNKVPASTGKYTAAIRLSLYGAEVHFPFFDVERNINGILLTRTNGNLSPDYTVYWDDSPITVTGGTPSNPLVNTTGISSLINGHKWGTPGAGPTEFGNEKSLDTWAYAVGTPIVATVDFTIRETDLETVSITSNTGCVGQNVIYTVVVRNNGPSDAVGTKFHFAYPTEITGLSATSAATTGTSALISGTVSAGAYDAVLDMSNGAVRTFTITGKVSAVPSGGSLNVTASMLRAADYTDPDATNPDTAPPTDPAAECNAAPSGAGCNNIKTNSTVFAALPNAGADQTVIQNTTVTLTANTTGTWSQLGITPTVAHITTPASATTTVTGLTDIGNYSFIFTSSSGCPDTVVIHVVTSAISIPNIFTPNGDGKNDQLVIGGLQFYPGSQLLIFNRWGNEVYSSDNYPNNWDGSGLTEGTYYYVLNRKEPTTGTITTFKGWIYLKR
ncbi:gliding motility-associated C-terminal domain-containing protein [Mucilaginibacter sp. AW1-3]